jgi:hypothetical protein
MSNYRIRIQIVPTRLGCWSVWVDGMRIVKSTREPLVEIAQRMLAAGHKRDARIWQTRTPDGPCRAVGTLADAAAAAVLPRRDPFREPEWKPLGNGVHQ